MTDDELMAAAIAEAKAAPDHGDVPIGAVVVLDGKVIASRHNERELQGDPTAHAEVLALRDAARAIGSSRLDGTTLVSTLEPSGSTICRLSSFVVPSSTSLRSCNWSR